MESPCAYVSIRLVPSRFLMVRCASIRHLCRRSLVTACTSGKTYPTERLIASRYVTTLICVRELVRPKFIIDCTRKNPDLICIFSYEQSFMGGRVAPCHNDGFRHSTVLYRYRTAVALSHFFDGTEYIAPSCF